MHRLARPVLPGTCLAHTFMDYFVHGSRHPGFTVVPKTNQKIPELNESHILGWTCTEECDIIQGAWG